MSSMASLPSLPSAGHGAPRIHLRAWVGLLYWRHGVWLPLALVLVLGAGVLLYDALTMRAARRQLDQAAAALKSAPVSVEDRPSSVTADQQRLNAFRQVLVAAQDSSEEVRRLVGLTQPELAWQRAQFQHSEDSALGTVQLQIAVPVKGEYRQMRKAVDRALLDMPNLSLDHVALQRRQASDSQLEAQLRFSLWLHGASAASVVAGVRP